MKRLLFFISGLIFLLPGVWGQTGPQELLSLALYRPIPANTCTNKASYVYTQSLSLRSELGLKGRQCEEFIIFHFCFRIQAPDDPNYYGIPLPGSDASIQPATPAREILPARSITPPYERQMHYRSAEMVMQSWQNTTGWQNTTITIKNTRL